MAFQKWSNLKMKMCFVRLICLQSYEDFPVVAKAKQLVVGSCTQITSEQSCQVQIEDPSSKRRILFVFKVVVTQHKAVSTTPTTVCTL
jgi:hypothetical protein